ncbi:helix-turn-helix domain-containing protein [Nordella sp. HKS 07]|uniref:helix-turn-helix domain-containing protein n=1 Tax=Nordella sp. HKS 07 TaxID=2712222 RepID=UPI0013E138D5|nr:helix-turn-helix domain-containing protein [Nordella sp. HKS 07]QIG48929.1 helix-turn-helix domain-containing protein [Nordella sp. HKS 07]
MRDEPALAPQLVSLLSRELENARGQIGVLNRRSAIERSSAFILELHRRQNNSRAPDAHIESGRRSNSLICASDYPKTASHFSVRCSSTIRLDLSRSDIADFLGLTIETVSRNLTKLKVKRIIHLPEIHKLVILNIGRLEALAAGGNEEW